MRDRPPLPPRKSDPRVPADLEAICLKCLEKDPRRRYPSADALANDLDNWLASRPILARRSGPLERGWLWCRRRPAVAALAASVALALVAGIGSVFAVQSRANAQLASKNVDLERANHDLERERLRAVEAEGEAKSRADTLQKLADFQSKMLAQVDPAEAGLRLTADVKGRFDAVLAKDKVPDDERARRVDEFMGLWGRVNATDAALALIDSTILKPAVEAIGEQFGDRPLIAATLRQSLAERYSAMGLTAAALPLVEQALKTRREALGQEHRETLAALVDLGNLLEKLGKSDEAIAHLREALETGRRVLGGDDRFVLNLGCDLGNALREKGDREGAEKLYGEALGTMRRLFGEDDRDTLAATVGVGILLRDQGRLNEAKEYQAKALEGRRRVLGPDDRDIQSSLMNMGAVLNDLGEYEEAASCFREVLEKRRRRLGEVHPSTLHAARSLAAPLQKAGKEDEAESLSRESLESSRRILGPDHPSTLVALNNLAVYLIEKGKLDEAEPLCRELLESQRRVNGPDHPSTLVATNVMGFVLVRAKKPADAEPYVGRHWRSAGGSMGTSIRIP
ncbi:MAG: tetratricopeptide repeat protein [Isosphaeraceae bacterium]